MRKIKASLLLVVVAAMPLSGCKALFGSSQFTAQKNQIREQQPADFAQRELTLGREALDKGNWAEAIIALRNAQRMPQFAAQAHNGMGVAYAQLGRADLAERYFLLAIAEAPEDRRYSANLARLHAQNIKAEALAFAAANPAPVRAAAPQRTALTTTNTAIKLERPATRLVRTAKGEIKLQTPSGTTGDTRMAGVAPDQSRPGSGVTFTRRTARPQ